MVIHDHDKKYLNEQVRRLPQGLRLAAKKRYHQIFSEIYAADGGEFHRARFEANTAIRRYADTITGKK
jgi:hypothetical protein